ncbi:transmembrane protein 131-like isoform X2 [Ochotona curzoniae]|uniref:transmembrane protein 131-like isoform X2 n=1 Tax=Ochotona curzoniae TaxID=130825 RepID=UPI001B3475F5|nr:transmembrane protein 131-like isoform X2 [Ochotona curzoniae]
MAGLRRPQPGCYCRTAAAVNLLLGVFQVLLPCCRPGGAQGQAIEPLPNVVELWQAEEGELLLPTQGDSEEDLEEPSQEQSFSDKLFSGKGLHFQPSVLDFGMQFLGLPSAKILYAYNPSQDREVVVNSVFTAARHFHVPPVHCRVIPAMGKTSFRIIFLPTEEGSIESSLFINTSSHGILSYHVSGIGTRRISPEGSARQPANAYFLLPQVQSIQLSQTQAEATNTSLLQVQLECSLHNKVCQQLKSCYLESEDVLRLQMSIIVTMENSSKEFEENTQDLLDHLSIVYVATDKSETSDDSAVSLYVLHSGSSLLWIQDVRHFSHTNALSLQFEPVLLPPSTTNFTKIASFTCKATPCGIVEVGNKVKSTPTLKACLASPVVPGYFRMDSAAVLFHMETRGNMSGVWSIWGFNHFDRSIVIKHVFVSKETKHILRILSFTGPLFLPPGCWNIFSLKLAVKAIGINLFTNIFLTTNIGAIFAIPLQIYSAPAKEGSLGFEVIAHCGMHYFMGKSKAENPAWDGSLPLQRSAWDEDSKLANKLHERWKRYKNGDVCRRSVLGMTRFAHVKKSKELESFVSSLPRLLVEPGLMLNFSVTAVRNSMVKYFVLKNPSSLPVSVQLLPLSLYPKPEATARLLHKWFGTDIQMINFTTSEFQLTKACPYRGAHAEESRPGVLHLHLQPLEVKRVGVVFTPADYGKVTSLILIRNNLTVLDVVGVEGFGARELLKVGGRLPGTGGSLRFKVPESTLMDCRQQLKDSKQILSITKNFKVENVGPLPITVTSLRINGYNCQGYGFEILDCHQFSLDPDASRDISIVFTPDFTSSWVIRELTLVTAAGLEFHFTLNVTLPHHLLPLCADVVPGPSWEESFWRLTVFFVSLSLLGVVLIAVQQAQYILLEFVKTRQRQSAGASSQLGSGSMDVVSSHTHKSTCKTFLDPYGPSDKNRGKSCLAVSSPRNRVQNAAKRSPASYGHSQKKHKCSVYYSKHKASSMPGATGASPAPTPDDRQAASGSPLSVPREDLCVDVGAGNWVRLGETVGLQKSLGLPQNLLSEEDSTPKAVLLVGPPSSECTVKEVGQPCVFPKEIALNTSENAELRQQELCPLKTSKKLPESHLPRSPPQSPPDLPESSRRNAGNTQQVPVKNEADSCEASKKPEARPPSDRRSHRTSKEDTCPEKPDTPPLEQEDPARKKKLQEKKEAGSQSLNWNKSRTCRKKKRGGAQLSRPPEQSELKLSCEGCEPSGLSGSTDARSWSEQESAGAPHRADGPVASGCPAEQRGAEGCCPKPQKKCRDKFCLDSSSDCGSSSGSVRASRGSWGSWSSTSSSEGDRKPMVEPQRLLLAGDDSSLADCPSEAPVSLTVSANICNATDASGFPQFTEPTCASLPAGPMDVTEEKGLYSPGDLWPVCLASSLNCTLEGAAPCVMQEPAQVHNSFIDWSAACEGPFPSIYCPLELNDYSSFPEETMNYGSGFPCPAEVPTDFMDHSAQSTWSSPANITTAWGHAGFISSPPYLTSTRSLSPMSGLFGSIWAPQNDVYENCCPLNPSAEPSAHMENQAVLCKEYYPGFNPFRAYMNLDIWTTTANRSANFPLSRDSGYCGNV